MVLDMYHQQMQNCLNIKCKNIEKLKIKNIIMSCSKLVIIDLVLSINSQMNLNQTSLNRAYIINIKIQRGFLFWIFYIVAILLALYDWQKSIGKFVFRQTYLYSLKTYINLLDLKQLFTMRYLI